MAVIAVYRVKGNPDELIEKYEGSIDAVERSAHGVPQVHITARTGDGIVIYDVWDSEGDIAKFTENPGFQEAMEAVDMPQPEVAVYEVHRMGWSRRA